MICPNCHAQIEDGSNFCHYCGYPLKGPEENMQAAGPAPSAVNPEEVDHSPSAPSLQPQMQPPADQNPPFPNRPPAPRPSPAGPRLHRRLSAIEVWLIIIGICALVALIISIVNAVHIEAIKDALIEVIQNLQGAGN